MKSILQSDAGISATYADTERSSATGSGGNPPVGREGWNILAEEVNLNKEYASIQPGTEILLDQQSAEIVWNSSQKGSAANNFRMQSAVSQDSDGRAKNPVSLGGMGPQARTVSHLLQAHPDYSGKIYDLVFAARNQEKAYTEIRPGTEVFVLQESGEIVWQGMAHSLDMGQIRSFSMETRGHICIVS